MQILKHFFCLILFFFLISSVSVMAADKGHFSIKPGTNDGKKWRIGYFEGGEYVNYQLNFLGIVRGLMDMGWMETAKIPDQSGEQTAKLWQWLVNSTNSRYIEFVKDAHYTGNWDTPLIEKMVPQIISRLNNKKDIDLIIAAGTKAGLKLATNDHTVPTLVISTTDPLTAGIIKSVADSGFDHVHARVDPYRHERQIKLFHDIIGFNKLGIAYQDTEQGRSYAALDSVKKVADERGFKIVPCFTTDEGADVKKDEESVKKCFATLGKSADAIYVTTQNGVNADSIPELVNIANKYRIPTFTQSHSEQVKYGFLMSISRANFQYVGRFYAKTMAKIFNGAKPRDIAQLFEDPPKIAINLKTAELIGYDPPVDVLSAADEIVEDIEIPKK
ncbi:ABC transporter substrate-binding protein [Desulfobacter hydrogenophilus]|uniref:ABC transporter substrate-binding protein n=1 Tax=Desulfobacter hydrogenophilus TaxID=2291 RepID=A0A328FH29_9BACT|nr:ABC transporter substrate binding protein [Desulfobacter hydrogenophilus]NDY70811.1 ABC transporter substrate-binding protein [Desulfobacter hydrogenophilus]QBH11583.1 ABC transporter substrate-binding protein [Desulfobacter hydrogenophilus]RAM03130.1 ABC transporter substrate-binding protein [Desulfobacter hydrogenophilus]